MKILLSVVIVLLIGVAAAGYQITTSTPGLWQATTTQDQQSTSQSSNVQSGGSHSGTQGGTTSGGSQSGTQGGSNVKISSKQAKSIAQKSIAEPGATAGTPQLKTINGKKTYYVPILSSSGKQIGGFYIDPQTGQITGMEGGVSP